MPDTKDIKQAIALLKKHGTLKAASRASDISYRQIRNLYKSAIEKELIEPLPKGRLTRERTKQLKPEGRIRERKFLKFDVPKSGEVNRYIFTCAQNNTKLHEQVWNNLNALAKNYKAQIIVA